MLNRQIAFNDDFAQKLIKQASRHHRPFKMHVEYLIEVGFKLVEDLDELKACKATLDEETTSATAVRRVTGLNSIVHSVSPRALATMDPSLIPSSTSNAAT